MNIIEFISQFKEYIVFSIDDVKKIYPNFDSKIFVRWQKKGYIEYDWKNPGETKARSKALYMLYFAPWDWIISVSTYRNEFIHLVNVEDFRKDVLDLHSGPSGYAFVFDGQGNALIHPKLQGVNLLKADNLPSQYLLEMHRHKTGKIIYPWKNPDEVSARLKLVIFNHHHLKSQF